MSLTHNYVDATNLSWVLDDAVRSFSQDILPILRDTNMDDGLDMLSSSLGLEASYLHLKLKQLHDFLSDEPQARQAVVEETARGDLHAMQVLNTHLEVQMPGMYSPQSFH